MSPEVRSLLKSLLVFAGTMLAARGVIEESQVEVFTGLGLTIVSAAWSAWIAHRTRSATEEIQRTVAAKVDGKLGKKTVAAVKDALSK